MNQVTTMQYAMEPAATSGYLSDGDTTAESINFAHIEGHQWSQLQDGTIEVTDRLPKKEYYLSLRRLNNSVPNTEPCQRHGSISSGSILGAPNGSVAVVGGTLTAVGTTPRSVGGTLRSRPHNPITDFKPSKKMVDCTVVMLDGISTVFSVDQAAYGQHLFDSVCDHLEIREAEYFGITYYDSTNNWCWLKLHKRIAKQLGKSDWQFEFQVKFYPFDVESMKDYLTRHYLCLQVRQDLVSGQLPCSFLSYCILGACIVQSDAGDYSSDHRLGIQYIENQPFAPHSLQTRTMLEHIAELHKLHRGQTPEEADRIFLQNARVLALFGVDLYKVKDTQNNDLNLGVYYGGIVVYQNRIRLMRIVWARIICLRFRGRNFIVQLRPTTLEPSNRTMTFKCASIKAVKRMFDVFVEHHAFFRLRGPEKPKKPCFFPSFTTRKYHYQSSVLQSPTLHPSSNGAPRPLSLFRPIPAHPKEAYGHINGNGQYPVHSATFDETGHPTGPGFVNSDHVMFGQTLDPHRFVSSGLRAPLYSGNENYVPTVHARPTIEAEPWKISLADRTAGLGIDVHGLDVAAQCGTGWQGCRANKGVKAPGAYYFETSCLEDGLIRVGWSTNDASLELGSDNCGFGFASDAIGASGAGGTGRAMHRNTACDYGVAVNKGDVIGCLLDFDKGSLSWSCNGTEFPRCFTIPDTLRGEPFFPAASLKNSRILFNFGEQSLDFYPAGPYVPVAQTADDSEVPNRNTGWRLNPFDASAAVDVAPDGSMVQAHLSRGWQGCRANQGIYGPGRFYFEISPLEETGLCRVGWSTEEASLDIGSDRFGYGYGADNSGFGLNGQQGKRMHNDEIDNYGEAFTKDDVIGCFLDTIERTVKWSKNGVEFGDAYHLPNNPSGNSCNIGALFPTVSLLNSTVEFNFGDKPFLFYPGPDWTPVCCAPADHVKRARRKGPERKVKGWSYIDPSALEPAMRQAPKFGQPPSSGATDRYIERREDDMLHQTPADSLSPTALAHSSSPNTSRIRRLPVGGVPLPGMTGHSVSPINPVDKLGLHARHTGVNGHASSVETNATASPPTHPIGQPLGSPYSERAMNGGQLSATGSQPPVYDLKDCTRLVPNGEVVVSKSVQHSKPQVQTESYINEYGKLIKRTVERSEVTTTQAVIKHILASPGPDSPDQGQGYWVNDDFDQALDAAVLEVTKLDRNTSVLGGTVDQVEFRTQPLTS